MDSRGLGGLAIVGVTLIIGGFLSYAVVGPDPAYALSRRLATLIGLLGFGLIVLAALAALRRW